MRCLNCGGEVDELQFSNSVFNEGDNTTVRRGLKWASKKGAFVVWDNVVKDRPVVTYCEFIIVKVKRFCDITPEDIKNEHDEKCRTYKGLMEEMCETYKDFSPSELVTIIKFNFSYT